MAYTHWNATRQIRGLPASTKYVLYMLADQACIHCGLVWCGVPSLVRDTELSESSIRRGLDQLRERHLIEPLRYSTGGRRRATEYVVLGDIVKLSTAPCGVCRGKMANPRMVTGYNNPVTVKPSQGDRVSGIPCQEGAENPVTVTPHPPEEPDPPRAHAREEAESATSRPGEPSAAPTAPAEPHFRPSTGNPELDDMLDRLNQRATLNPSTEQPRR